MRIQARPNGPLTIQPPIDGAPPQPSVLLAALIAMRDGDFSVRLPSDWTGLDGKIADTFNQIVAASARMASELERVGDVVGKQGLTRQGGKFELATGAGG